ncbi:Flap endonuclease 1 [Linum grandiflorum]
MVETAPIYYIIIAFFCTVGAIAFAVAHIYKHLLNYTEPTYQRFIVRIVFMVPVYALMSFLSLILPQSSIYFNSIREVYEAWVIYNFLSLCLAWVGGPGSVVLSLTGRVMKPSWCLMTCCFPPIPLDGHLLQPFNPVPKFVMIKSVVFLTYWQGVLVFLAAKSGFIKNAEEAARFQDFIICVEMLIAAIGHFYAFPYKEYAGANIGGPCGLSRSLGHALKLNDFYHDTVHQFAPTYHDYVLYNHNEGEEGAVKYRSRTFVPTGQEMDAVRRNKHLVGNKLDDIQLASHSSSGTSTPKNASSNVELAQSEAMKSSLLVDTSNSLSVPYDMSLIDMDLSNYPPKVPAAAANDAPTSYVFDGQPPDLKKQELAKRYSALANIFSFSRAGNKEDIEKFSKRTVKVTKQHNEDCKKLLRLMGVPVIEAYAVASEDMDSLTFGAPRFLRHLMDPSSRKIPVMEFEVSKILEDLNLSMDQFIDLCILSGCDYCDNIRGIGGLTALKLIRQHGSIEGIIQNISKERYQIAEDWPYQEARRLFQEPNVLTDEEQEIKWASPDEEGLVSFLVNENGFNADRVTKAIEKIKAAKNKSAQGRMESFFKPVANTTVPNKRKEAGNATDNVKKGKAGGAGGGKKKRK